MERRDSPTSPLRGFWVRGLVWVLWLDWRGRRMNVSSRTVQARRLNGKGGAEADGVRGTCATGISVKAHAPAGLALALELTGIAERNSVNLLNDQLANGHAGIQRNIERAKVDQFQRDGAVKLCVDSRSGEVNEKGSCGNEVRRFNVNDRSVLVGKQSDGISRLLGDTNLDRPCCCSAASFGTKTEMLSPLRVRTITVYSSLNIPLVILHFSHFDMGSFPWIPQPLVLNADHFCQLYDPGSRDPKGAPGCVRDQFRQITYQLPSICVNVSRPFTT